MSNFKFLVMMKSKYLLVTALSAAALTACNNDEVLEVNQGRGISFQVATEAATRAAATTTNTINKFKVWGFTDNKTLMDGVEVTKSSGTWSYDNIIFWPASSVDFYSVSPGTVTGVSITNEAQKITGFTVAEKQDEQIDLLYAVNKGEEKEKHETEPVSINFRHALSQIVFKAKNTNENLKVIVKGVKIANIKKAGDFTYPSQSTTTQYTSGSSSIVATTQGEWDNVTTEQTFAAGMNVNGVTLEGKVETALDLTSKENEVYTGALFMIPQALTPWDPEATGALNTTNKGVYFLVDCQILSGTNKDIQVWPSDPKVQYAEVAIPASELNWEQGKKYIYTFTFGEGGGYVPGEEPDPDPTLIGIDFNVTVDEFKDGGEQDIDMETGEE